MIQVGYGWYVNADKYKEILKDIELKFNKTIVISKQCPNDCDLPAKDIKFCPHCGSKLEVNEEEDEDESFDAECYIYDNFHVNNDDPNKIFIGVAEYDLMGDNILLSSIHKEIIIDDELDGDMLFIVRLITDDKIAPTRIFDDGYYDREWDCR